MITIFTTPRPFKGYFDTIQRNAIKSWLKLGKEVKIILFEDEEGTTSAVAKELGIKCITDVKTNEFGTALLNDIFNKVKKESGSDIIVHVNTDIILMPDFLSAIKKAEELVGEGPFFMSGRRWDLDLNEEINYENKNWERDLRNKIRQGGKLHGLSGMDYWVFSADDSYMPPPFAIGRPGMDSWLVYKFRSMHAPVIDSTEMVTIIHHNHNYPSKKKPFYNIERARNLELAGGFMNTMTLREANFILTKDGLVKPGLPRSIFTSLALFYPWRFILSVKRKIGYLRGK